MSNINWHEFNELSNWLHDYRYLDKDSSLEIPFLYFEKRYPRFERYKIKKNDNKIFGSFVRYSTRSFLNDAVFKFSDLELLLNPLFPVVHNGSFHMNYSSAGGIYAVECYIYCNNVEKLDSKCIYHVLKSESAIEKLWDVPCFFASAFESQDWINNSSLIIILTLNMTPYYSKYGDRGYRFGLIEVGSVVQLLTTSNNSDVFKSCVLGGFSDSNILKSLNIPEQGDEKPICCIAFGK